MIINNLLNEQELCVVIDSLNNPLNWSEKQLTGNLTDPFFKSNKEYIHENKPYLDNIVIEALNINRAWREYIIAPKSTSDILFLKYDVGSVYKYHADVSKGSLNAYTYANTLFLSDPEDYEGGELIITINGERISYKLNKNSLLTYPVGLKHEVTPITKGKRHVAVFWTESWVTDERDRTLLRELGEIHNSLSSVSKEFFSDLSTSDNPLSESLIDLTRLSEEIHNRYPRWRDPRCDLITE